MASILVRPKTNTRKRDCCSSSCKGVIDAQVQGMEEISEQKWKEPDRRHRPASCCHLSYCSLDVHRRRREPKLDLDAASPSETRPSQPVELFGETECALDEGLPFGEPL